MGNPQGASSSNSSVAGLKDRLEKPWLTLRYWGFMGYHGHHTIYIYTYTHIYIYSYKYICTQID